jgi:uncharacterized protein YbjT (DUF2867 family)
MTSRILIIGKNGKTGRRVEERLMASGYETRGVSRSTLPSFDWLAPETWQAAMTGCTSAYVCFQPDLAVPGAQKAMTEFIRQAKIAGITHIVLLSGRGEEGAQNAEKILIQSGLEWNIVRASWFAQNFSEGFLIDGILSGMVSLPSGDIPEPFIDIDDIAEVAVSCLTKPKLINQVFEVTGPEALTFKDCVRIIASVTQTEIAFNAMSAEHFITGLTEQGLPDDVLWLMNELFTVVMDGRNATPQNGVEEALGRPATSFYDYATKAFNSGVWSKPNIRIDDN